MRKGSIIFLQVVVVLIGIGALALMLWEPQIEGRNVNAALFEIYFKDPFLAYAYVASIPFFVALYKVFGLLGDIGRGNVFSQRSVRALRVIKYCMILLVCSVLGAEGYLFIFQRGKEDIAGGAVVGLFIILVFVAIGTGAAVFERRLKRRVGGTAS